MQMNKEQLTEILSEHLKWLSDDGGKRANLRNADLRNADLRNANLRNADLRDADLSYANLRNANLRNADLSYANLSYANLRNANLVYFTFNQHVAYFTFNDQIRVGCEYHPINHWLENFESIGKANKYSDLEIIAYKNFFNLCMKLQNDRGTKE